MELNKPKIKLKSDWGKKFVIPDTRTYDEITNRFKDDLNKLTNSRNRFIIKDFFGDGLGFVSSRNKLKNTFNILENKEDFQGIYVFYYKEEPFYTGISRSVLKRIQQHVKGGSHFTSSLCYTMGAEWYKERHQQSHKGGRKGLEFKTYSEPFKELLKEKTSVAILPIKSSVELYLFECYVAITLNTQYYNKFETH